MSLWLQSATIGERVAAQLFESLQDPHVKPYCAYRGECDHCRHEYQGLRSEAYPEQLHSSSMFHS
jgi:hypothetical protein